MLETNTAWRSDVGANVRFQTFSDYVRHEANMLVECRTCPNKSVLHSRKVQRWFWCYRWSEVIEVAGAHMRCHVCRGRPAYIRPTAEKPTYPGWMQYEHQWGALVKRLRNW